MERADGQAAGHRDARQDAQKEINRRTRTVGWLSGTITKHDSTAVPTNIRLESTAHRDHPQSPDKRPLRVAKNLPRIFPVVYSHMFSILVQFVDLLLKV